MENKKEVLEALQKIQELPWATEEVKKYRELLNKEGFPTIKGRAHNAPLLRLTEAEAIEKAHRLAELYSRNGNLEYLKRHLSCRITGIDLDPIVEQYAQGTPQIMD